MMILSINSNVFYDHYHIISFNENRLFIDSQIMFIIPVHGLGMNLLPKTTGAVIIVPVVSYWGIAKW